MSEPYRTYEINIIIMFEYTNIITRCKFRTIILFCPVLITPLGGANVRLLITGPQAAGKLELEETGPAVMPKPDPTGNQRVYTHSFIRSAVSPRCPGWPLPCLLTSCNAFVPSLPCQAT